MARELLPLSYHVADQPIGGETLYTDAGASVLVLTSCFADLGLELRSAYLSGERIAEILVAESAVVGSTPAKLRTRWLPDAEADLSEWRRGLLYDHLQALQDLAVDAGHQLGFDGVGPAVALLDARSALG